MRIISYTWSRVFVETRSLNPIRSRSFIKICKLKPNKKKTLRSTIFVAAFGFCRSHCGGGFPYCFH